MDVLPLHLDADSKPNSIAGIDGIRAFAAVGVVLLHACVPYLQHPMPGLAWPVRDVPSQAVDWLFWSVEIFIMPLFLVLAGMLAWKTFARRGATVLVRNRAKRLLLPLLFAIVVILPLDLYAWLVGWVAEGLIEPMKLRSLKFDGVIDQHLWGLSHLWFLEYLFLYVASIGIWSMACRKFTSLNQWRPTFIQGFFVLLAIAITTLYLRPEVVWGFQHQFYPVASKFVYSGTFFAGGFLIAKHDPNFRWLTDNAKRLVMPAVLLTSFAVMLGRWHLSGQNNELAQFSLVSMTVLAAWAMTLSVIGVVIGNMQRVPASIAYLSAGSFWVYLIHHPVLGVVHIDLKWLLPDASPALKTALALVVCFSISMLTYEAFIRKTWLGKQLGMNWTPQSNTEQPATAIVPTQQRRAA